MKKYEIDFEFPENTAKANFWAENKTDAMKKLSIAHTPEKPKKLRKEITDITGTFLQVKKQLEELRNHKFHSIVEVK